MSNHVSGRVIVISGGASGFGRVVAQKPGALGARVVAADVNEAELEATVKSVTEAGLKRAVEDSSCLIVLLNDETSSS